MKPAKIVLFLTGVFFLLALAMLITPSEGVDLEIFRFHMPTFQRMFTEEEESDVDLREIIDNQINVDMLMDIRQDSARNDQETAWVSKAHYDSLAAKIQNLDMAPEGRANLFRFFQKLENDTLVRIMHYGDSQIEGDRMTAFIRNKLQVRFGGTGIGLRPAVQPYDFVYTAEQHHSGNWQRFSLYGKRDSLVEHNKYGAMAAFSRFAPLTADSLLLSASEDQSASVSIVSAPVAFKRSRIYENFRLFYGNSRQPVRFRLMAEGNVIGEDTLQPSVDYGMVEFDLPNSTSSVQLFFEGKDSPDIYGIELASKKGVVMDNIAMRGSSGLIFTQNHLWHSKKMVDDLRPDLFILQFGGNVVPYIDGEKAIARYGRLFRAQIQRIKRLCPEASIIVIGPGDMSTREKGRFVTYPALPAVVKVLRETALSSGCSYWNMYEAMGGENSMPSWVNAEPELARPDYVHLSTRGARLTGNMFYNALIFEFNKYLREKRNKERNIE